MVKLAEGSDSVSVAAVDRVVGVKADAWFSAYEGVILEAVIAGGVDNDGPVRSLRMV